MSAASKRAWRADLANREAERLRDETRASRRSERTTEEGRLAEAMRDTLRHIANQEHA